MKFKDFAELTKIDLIHYFGLTHSHIFNQKEAGEFSKYFEDLPSKIDGFKCHVENCNQTISKINMKEKHYVCELHLDFINNWDSESLSTNEILSKYEDKLFKINRMHIFCKLLDVTIPLKLRFVNWQNIQDIDTSRQLIQKEESNLQLYLTSFFNI